MSSSAKAFIGALVVLNLALVGLLLFRDRSITPADARERPAANGTELAAAPAVAERAGGTDFVSVPSVVAPVSAEVVASPVEESRTEVAEPPVATAPPRSVVRPSPRVAAPRPEPEAAPPARRESEAEVASLPSTLPVLAAETRREESRPAPPPPAPRPITITVPAGQSLPIALGGGLHSREVRSGDAFEATLREALVVDGRELVPAGSDVTGRVLEVIEAGKTKGVEHMSLTLSELTIAGKTYTVTTSKLSFDAEDTKEKEAAMIGGAAVVGAIIGGIAGGKKGAVAGAATGAAAGTGAAVSTRGKPVTLASGAHLDFVLTESLRVTLPPPAAAPEDPSAPEPAAPAGVARR